MTGSGFAAAVKQLRSGSAPEIDEIISKYLKVLDVKVLSLVTQLCNIAWKLETVPVE